jgi:hypothetical protein
MQFEVEMLCSVYLFVGAEERRAQEKKRKEKMQTK